MYVQTQQTHIYTHMGVGWVENGICREFLTEILKRQRGLVMLVFLVQIKC